MLDKLKSADFMPYLNQKFLILVESTEPFETELISVTELGKETTVGRRPFSIILRSPIKDRYLPQRIYTVEHDRMGRLDLFLVPIGPDDKGMRYQAVFT